MDDLLNLADFETAALARLPAGVRDYYRGGANDEVALRENRAAWDRWQVHYRVLRDVAVRDLSTRVPGGTLDWPVMIALMHWGDKYEQQPEGRPSIVVHKGDCGGEIDDRRICTRCGKPLGPREAIAVDGPGLAPALKALAA